MKTLSAYIILFLFPVLTSAQSPAPLSIDSCYVQARRNYPLAKQRELLLRSVVDWRANFY